VRKAQPEAALQRALCKYLNACLLPPAMYFAVPNGGARNPVEAAIMSGLGVKRGMPDLCIIYDSQPYLLELKSADGRLSDHQRERIEELIRAGARVGIAYSLEQAIGKIQGWGLPLRSASGLVLTDAVAIDEQLGEAMR
jgi:hypothetical protein